MRDYVPKDLNRHIKVKRRFSSQGENDKVVSCKKKSLKTIVLLDSSLLVRKQRVQYGCVALNRKVIAESLFYYPSIIHENFC